MKVRHVLALALMLIAAVLVAGCGDEKSNEPPQELEDTLGFGSGDGAKEVQSRVENQIRDCMRAQGFQYVPVDPFAQQQAVTGKARITDEDFTEAVRVRHQHALRQGQPAGRPQRAGSPEPCLRGSGSLRPGARRGQPRRHVRRGARLGRLHGAGRLYQGRQRGGLRGAAVPKLLVEKLDGLDERIIQDQRMVKANEKWAACMAEKGFRYEEPRRDRQRAARALPGHRRLRDRARVVDHTLGHELRPRRAHRACSARRCGSRTPTWTASSRRSSRWSVKFGRSTRSSSARRTSSCLARVKPAEQNQ